MLLYDDYELYEHLLNDLLLFISNLIRYDMGDLFLFLVFSGCALGVRFHCGRFDRLGFIGFGVVSICRIRLSRNRLIGILCILAECSNCNFYVISLTFTKLSL